MMTLVGGNPYLIDLTLRTIINHSILLEIMLAKAATEEEIYRDRLRELWIIIKQQLVLKNAFRKIVIVSYPVNIDPTLIYQLDSIGLIKISGNEATHTCNLYRQYFSRLLTAGVYLLNLFFDRT